MDLMIDSLLAALTPEQKLGQMLMFGFTGQTIDGAAQMLNAYLPGGLIVMGKNAQDIKQLAALTAASQTIALQNSAGIGLLFSTDQEGGRVQHLPATICRPLPSSEELAAKGTGAPSVQAQTTATDFKAVGMNMNLAPVLDVRTNLANKVIGNRSYGADPNVVAKLGCEYIAALQAEGIIACAKHFPGHGASTDDSHTGKVAVKLSSKEMDIHLSPFRAAVKAGVETVMSAHVIFPEDRHPATLSSYWLNKVLRKKLGFKGVIITDSLGMGAISQNYSPEDMIKRGLSAGVDIFLACEGDEIKQKLFESLSKQAARNPRRIDESVRRILLMKSRYGLLNQS